MLPVRGLLHHGAAVACATANTRSAPPAPCFGAAREQRLEPRPRRALTSDPMIRALPLLEPRSPVRWCRAQPLDHRPRTPHGWLHLSGVSRHNLHDVSV
ncbi:hypothetical protein, partial [Streptomyces sp. NPDC005078]|uniref:hypothetical protein n=1 Tax=unclassified Streptomyces TaxID=2593676 RepID=UPI0033A98A10